MSRDSMKARWASLISVARRLVETIGEAAGVEAVLQRPLSVVVLLAHWSVLLSRCAGCR